MTLPLDQFQQRVADSGLLSAAELGNFVQSLPAGERPTDGQQLARQLVKREKLTPFQAQEIYRGAGKALVLGSYVVLDKLGQGGMGLVLKAEHTRMKRLVALKILSPAVTKSPQVLRRFQREVEAAAKLRHSNIVAADDADEAGGLHFLVMEYIEGSDLSALVKKSGPLPLEQALHCVLQAARGLEYAHGRGVVHRDIKPANLLLDREGTVKILDMGLARIDTAGERQDELTGTGQMMGTVDYMAPEQAVDTKTADQRADIYALGVTLWYLLTGRAMYENGTTVEKLLAHQQQPIPSLRAACPSVSQELDAVFQKMVAKTPEARQQNMGEVIAALEQFRTSASGSGPKPPPLVAKAANATVDQAAQTLAPGGTAIVATPPISSPPLVANPAVTAAPRNISLVRVAAVLAGICLLATLPVGVWYFTQQPTGGTGQGITSNPGSEPGSGTKPDTGPKPENGSPPPAKAPFDGTTAKAHQDAWAKYLGVPVEHTNRLGMKLVLIPPGEFQMGSTPEETEGVLRFVKEDEHWQACLSSEVPKHTVVLTRPIYLGDKEVTQKEYETVIGANPSKYSKTGEGRDAVANLRTMRHPVEMVSWLDAARFCNTLGEQEGFQPHYAWEGKFVKLEPGPGYRLPTEAEWEFACRAGTTTKFWIGENYEVLMEAAWFARTAESHTHLVGKVKANPFGLYDMHGNVWEWVQDKWLPTYYARFQTQPAIDPTGATANAVQRVMRGGDFQNLAPHCRSSSRYAALPTYRDEFTGFRLALSVEAVKQAIAAPRATP